MDWQAALRARLLAADALTSLVGSKIFWMERPQASGLPAITLQTVADARGQHLKGFDSLQPARVQIDVWAETYASSRAVTEALLMAAVPAWRGHGHVFSRAMVELPPRDLIESVATGADTETRVFRVSMDLTINHALSEEES